MTTKPTLMSAVMMHMESFYISLLHGKWRILDVFHFLVHVLRQSRTKRIRIVFGGQSVAIKIYITVAKKTANKPIVRGRHFKNNKFETIHHLFMRSKVSCHDYFLMNCAKNIRCARTLPKINTDCSMSFHLLSAAAFHPGEHLG